MSDPIYQQSNVIWREDVFPFYSLYRDRGPAMITVHGYVHFVDQGSSDTGLKMSRSRGPATICPTGTIFYKILGIAHRTDGPAVINADGSIEYWVNGNEVNALEYFAIFGVR